jgi:hypothetical protein
MDEVVHLIPDCTEEKSRRTSIFWFLLFFQGRYKAFAQNYLSPHFSAQANGS